MLELFPVPFVVIPAVLAQLALQGPIVNVWSEAILFFLSGIRKKQWGGKKPHGEGDKEMERNERQEQNSEGLCFFC